jgi:succinate dehydrogenase / fumarate reductase flavoprotein subunit
VVIDDRNTVVPGLFAAGECACVSVHGANRLGTNSLLDLVVFGKHAGLKAAEYAKTVEFIKLPEDAESGARSQFEALMDGSGEENVYDLSNEMKDVMFSDVGVYRNGSAMEGAIDGIMELKEKYKHVRVSDTGKVFNTELLNAWELGNLLDIAEVVAMCALNRTESRGGHSREDYPERDDENWLKHTLITMKNGKLEITYKPVVITKYEPKARVY